MIGIGEKTVTGFVFLLVCNVYIVYACDYTLE